jgi:hypothetical protein
MSEIRRYLCGEFGVSKVEIRSLSLQHSCVAAERERFRGQVDAAREGCPEAAHWLADLARHIDP